MHALASRHHWSLERNEPDLIKSSQFARYIASIIEIDQALASGIHNSHAPDAGTEPARRKPPPGLPMPDRIVALAAAFARSNRMLAPTMLSRLLARRRTRHHAQALYEAIVSRARQPQPYAEASVPDTPEGRFEVLAALVVVLLHRLGGEGAPGAVLARAVVETFISDMDSSVRELGIGDTGVARRVKKAAAALRDRHAAYGPTLVSGDTETLAQALSQEAGGLLGDETATARLARWLMTASRELDRWPSERLLAGELEWTCLKG